MAEDPLPELLGYSVGYFVAGSRGVSGTLEDSRGLSGTLGYFRRLSGTLGNFRVLACLVREDPLPELHGEESIGLTGRLVEREHHGECGAAPLVVELHLRQRQLYLLAFA